MGQASKQKTYKIIEYTNELTKNQVYLCQVYQDGKPVGDHFEARDHEQMFAWLRLMVGAYPGTNFEDYAA